MQFFSKIAAATMVLAMTVAAVPMPLLENEIVGRNPEPVAGVVNGPQKPPPDRFAGHTKRDPEPIAKPNQPPSRQPAKDPLGDHGHNKRDPEPIAKPNQPPSRQPAKDPVGDHGHNKRDPEPIAKVNEPQTKPPDRFGGHRK